MSKRNRKSSEWSLASSICCFLLAALVCSGCDRGASEQIQAAERFAQAVASNNIPARDSMIATRVFMSYFTNDFVSRDFFDWMRTIYDVANKKFFSTSRADVDRDLRQELAGGLLYDGDIEETGIVRVKSPNEGEQPGYFWMVKQKGRHWAVAIATKGESAVNFK